MINCIIAWMQLHCSFAYFLEYDLLFPDYSVYGKCEKVPNIKSLQKAIGCCLANAWFFYQFQPGVAYKSVAYKKSIHVSIKLV